MKSLRRGSIALLVLAYAGFVSLGLPDAVQGIAWPNVRTEFSQSQTGLGLILAFGGAGYFLSSFFTGQLLRLMHVGSLLVLSTATVSTGLFGFSETGSWMLYLACSFLIGLGSGAIDGGLNSFASRNFSSQHMAWLHGCYGIGASIGPLVMAHAVVTRTWRTGFFEIAFAMFLLALAFAFSRSTWNAFVVSKRKSELSHSSLRDALTKKAVLLQVMTFFVYTGLEVTVGQWSFTLNTLSRRMSVQQAGMLTFLFWASLTLGRFLLGGVVGNLGAERLLTLSFSGALIGCCLFSFPSVAMSTISLVLIGLSLASIYPVLMSETPRRVGSQLTDHAIGLQVSFATLGVIVVPNVVGWIAERAGLWVIPLLATLLVLCLPVLHGLALNLHRKVEPSRTGLQ